MVGLELDRADTPDFKMIGFKGLEVAENDHRTSNWKIVVHLPRNYVLIRFGSRQREEIRVQEVIAPWT